MDVQTGVEYPPIPHAEQPLAGFPAVPDYLHQHYWWAYVHPRAVRVFERPWLVNLILWGNYRRLGSAALAALGPELGGASLQVACVYGDLTRRLAAAIGMAAGRLDVVDVLAHQLANLRDKLPAHAPVRLLRQDSSALDLADASYDRALLFFLLHEQPPDVRARTLSEVLRVVRPGGRVVIVDFAPPRRWQPLRYLWLPVLRQLEPFASDLFDKPAETWLPPGCALERQDYFGGMYQLISITR